MFEFESILFHIETYYQDRVEKGAVLPSQFEGVDESGVPLGMVAVLTLNRPDRGNSISANMGGEIARALDYVEDPSHHIRALVLTGSGKFFCTGMDLMRAATEQRAEEKESDHGANERSPLEFFRRIKDCAVPVIARINGPALAGGWGLAFCADLRVAERSAFFSLPEVKRGIVPALISSFIVPEVGEFLARDLMVTGRRLSAPAALQLGLLTAVSSQDASLDQQVEGLAREVLSAAPRAVATAKRMVAYVAGASPRDRQAHVEALAEGNFSSREAAHGIRCFLAKQQPNWFVAKL